MLNPYSLALATRIWSAIAGIITLYLLASILTPVEQGFYFALVALSQMGPLLDLGMQTLILQLVSHEQARVNLLSGGYISGANNSVGRVLSAARYSMFWYLIGSVVYFPGLVIFGYWTFEESNQNIAWQLPWLSLIFLLVTDQLLNSIFLVLEGLNDLFFIHAARFIRALIFPVVIWICLLFSMGLWAIPLSFLICQILSLLLLIFFRKKFTAQIMLGIKKTTQARLSWRLDIFPLQWRLALSSIAGVITYNLMTPLAFKFGGALEAGKFGLSWAIAEAIFGIAILAISLKFPEMGGLASRSKWTELNKLSKSSGITAIAISVLGVLAFLGIVALLDYFKNPYSIRVLGGLSLILLMASVILKTYNSILIFYLRAHKKEPIFGLAMIATTGSIFLYYFGASTAGVYGLILAYFAINLLYWAPVLTFITYVSCKKWHIKW